MPTKTSHRYQVIRFGCHDTRRNFPAATASKRGEANFLTRFEKVFFSTELKGCSKQHFASGREFGLDGFGRADLLFMAWKLAPASEGFTALALKNRVRLTTIEAKLKDWRKGLMQASRYRFFANRSILVLSPDAARIAIGFSATFRALNVGLWEFDPEMSTIQRHFTPCSGKPLNEKAREKAIHAISQRLKLG